ncbi:DgyrCDS8710 [Dimorphilus gyrociliatus]|uniref:DgyrCDS8710 n=1 Tax=Dimorphilus gyrociliatus TaxID=2664684 RepID=A0A7I8VV68_9ANNE|nr:DgyrCDS8710 [Dimorphilus gyrociliatus]
MEANDKILKCKSLIIASGLSKPVLPTFEGSQDMIGYEEMPLDEDFYKGKDVLILGHGNSAFETANAIYEKTNKVHILGRNRVRLAWETHYVGDIRSVYSHLIDTYQLKSLDGILEGEIKDFKLKKVKDKFYFQTDNLPDTMDNFALREGYDIVIRCLGFKFDNSIFSDLMSPALTKSEKYPEIDDKFQSTNIENLYFIGTTAHSLDYRRSSGGFIHGFRYMKLITVILKRINEVSSLYQMHGVLGDIIAIDRDNKQFHYFENYLISNLHNFENVTGYPINDVLILVLNYGKTFTTPGNDVLRIDRATGVLEEAHLSNFLHPQFYYYEKLPTKGRMLNKRRDAILPLPDKIHYILEDFHTTWTSPTTHILPLRRFLENCTKTDLRHYKSSDCFLSSFVDGTFPIDSTGGSTSRPTTPRLTPRSPRHTVVHQPTDALVTEFDTLWREITPTEREKTYQPEILPRTPVKKLEKEDFSQDSSIRNDERKESDDDTRRQSLQPSRIDNFL